MRRQGTLSLLLLALVACDSNSHATTFTAAPDSGEVGEVAVDSLPGRLVLCGDVLTRGVALYAQRIFTSGAVDTSWSPDSTDLCPGLVASLRETNARDAVGGFFLPDLRHGGDEPDIVLQHLAADGSAANWPSRGLRISPAPNSQYHLDMAPDGEGGAYLVWEDYRQGRAGDIYGQRIAADGSVAAGWPEAGLVVCDAPGEQSLPRLSFVDGSLWVTWQDRRGGSLRAYLQRITPAGAPEPGWAEGGTLVGAAEPPVFAPCLAADSLGSIALLWASQDAAGFKSLLALAVTNFSPQRGVANSPLMLSASMDDLGDPSLARISSDHLLVCWIERRGNQEALRAQKLSVTGGGQMLWAPGGVEVRAGPLGGGDPAIAIDAAGGVLIAWEDERRAGQTDVFAQRLASSGDRADGWPEGGLAVSLAAGDQFAPAVTLGNKGDVVVTWAEAREEAPSQLLRMHPLAIGPPPRLIRKMVLPSHVRLVWQLPRPIPGTLTVQRRLGEGEWENLAALAPDDSLHLTLDDKTVPEGVRAEYRLTYRNGELEVSLEAIAVDVPGAPRVLLLHAAWARPSTHAIRLSFALPRGVAPLVDLIDVAGRRLARERFDGLEPGDQEVQLQVPPGMASGIYFVRLVQGSQARVAKVVYIR